MRTPAALCWSDGDLPAERPAGAEPEAAGTGIFARVWGAAAHAHLHGTRGYPLGSQADQIRDLTVPASAAVVTGYSRDEIEQICSKLSVKSLQ